MKPFVRKGLLTVLALVVLLPPAAYWLADRWLESSGGREMIEAELSRRAGMNVRLSGEFDLMLYPAIGVSGTGLSIGGEGPDSEFASSREYEISVALRPLLDRRVLVEWIRLTGGEIHPDRYDRTGSTPGEAPAGAAVDAVSAAIESPKLPEIQELTIRDLTITLPGEELGPLQLKQLTIRNFADNRDTPFSLEIDGLASLEGNFRWDFARSLVHVGTLHVESGGQRLQGEGCLDTQTPVTLHLSLHASVFDLDAFRQSLPGAGGMPGQGGESGGLPFEIRMRFSADELTASGVLARGVVLSLGDEPQCD